MNIDKARKIDYWIGIPLCFLLSTINYIKKFISFKKNTSTPVKKVLFIKFSELGAIILAYPLMDRIKKEYLAADLFFVTFDKNRGIFKLLGGVIPKENILGIRETPIFFILDTLKAIKRLRKERIDIIFDLEFFSRFSAIFSYLTKAKKIIGFYRYTFEGLYRGNILTHRAQYNPLNHIAKNYLSLSQAVKSREKNTPQLEEDIIYSDLIFPKYISDNKVKEKVLRKLKDLGVIIDRNKLFLINPGEGILPLREWPVENFIKLSNLILAEKDNYIVIIGTEGAGRKASYMLKSINNSKCINMVNQTELDELIELFAISSALISNDCGLAHLAMLTSINKFIIFGPESPQVFGPITENSYPVYLSWPCSPCLSVFNHRNSLCSDNKCLKVIEPKFIYELIMKFQ